MENQQLLTSDHLNKLFGYVDEQGRLTRANLIGIGILCGLEVNVNDAGTEITISKGCGITSLGYLVSTEARTYTEFKTYDVTQDRKYSMFVNGSNKPRFHIDELKTESSTAGTTRITAAYLQNRVVVMYVELLAENGKNCDPNSCDDKGINITVNLRPLLIHRDDVAMYMGAIASAQPAPGTTTAGTLPELQMRRFNVPSTPLPDSPSLLGAYQAILNQSFLSSLESTLTQSFAVMSPLLADLYTGNPFAGIASKYKFLYDGSISASDLVYIQYYYDLFSDVYAAYNDFREAAVKIMGVCMPDENLFPQHLLLGPAGNTTPAVLLAQKSDVAIRQAGSALKLSDTPAAAVVKTDSSIIARAVSAEQAPVALVQQATSAVAKYAAPKVDASTLSYRNDFMPSAALRSCCAQVSELRGLFKRLASLLGKFSFQRRNFTILQTYGNTGVVGPRTTTSSVFTAEVANANLTTAAFTKAAATSGLTDAVFVKSATSAFASPTKSFAVSTATGVAAAATPARINISTGVNAAGTVQGVGVTETNWTCPANMKAVISPNPAWGTFAGAAWLGNGNAEVGNFVFTRTFTITSSGTINFQALADNKVTMTLDGVQIAVTPGGPEYGYRSANVVTYTGLVSTGTHTLTATVNNAGGPAGLILTGSVAYTIPAPVPPPPPPLPPPPPQPVGPIVPVRITPSFLGDVELSDKSIPYYYDAVGGSEPLYRQWDYTKTIKNKADRNLSYSSQLYNSGTPDYVVQALRYDLERYNFMRVEGHIGAPFQDAVKNITAIRDQYRLPFEVIALRSTLAPAVTNEKDGCCTEGIELSYDILKAEWTDTVTGFTDYIANTPAAAGLFDAQGYTSQLQQSVDLLKADVPAFVGVYASFLSRMGVVETTGRQIRQNMLTMLYGAAPSAPQGPVEIMERVAPNNVPGRANDGGQGTIPARVYEDLIDELDKLINNYKKTAFTEIYNAYKLSLTSVERALSLQEYLKENPGIQHKAGVTIGGTFVLVYHTKPVAVTQTTNTGTSQQSASQNTQNQSARMAATVAQSNVVAQDGVVAQVSSALPKTVTAVNYDIVKAVNELVLLKDNGAAPAKLEDKLREILWVKDTTPVQVKQEVVNIFDTIIEGTVIADFYVPYICCEDCPAVRFVPSEDAPEQAVIEIDKKVFCTDDDTHYPVTITPEGGELTGDGLVTETDGTVSFVPSTVVIPAGTYVIKPVLTYTTTEGSTTFVQLTVSAIPVAGFNMTADGNTVTLQNTTVGTTSVVWTFDDGFTSNEFNLPSHTFDTSGAHTVTLIATNGECSDEVTQEIETEDQDVTVDIDTDQRKFCQGNEEGMAVYNITVQPVDAVLTIGGTVVTPVSPGLYHFSPLDVNIPAGISTIIPIKAEKGTKSQSFNVIVNAVPDATFTYSVNGTTVSFSNPQTSNDILWDFGGGNTSTIANPTFNFGKAGTYPVTRTVTNDGCQQIYTTNVVIVDATISVSPGGIICLSTDTNPRTLTGTPTGGNFSGEGVNNSQRPVLFNPAVVDFGAATQKDVVLTYTVNGLVAHATVRVYKGLPASFSATDNGNGLFSFLYTGAPESGLSWSFGEGEPIVGNANPTHRYTKAGTYTVTLTVKNDPCPDFVLTQQVVIKDVTVSLDPADSIICLGQDTRVRAINVSPAGGTLKIDGVVFDTPATFDPTKVNLGGANQKQVVFTYTVGSTTATTSVMVYKAIDATFTYTEIGNNVVSFVYEQQVNGTLRWSFGDQQTQEGPEKQIQHRYEVKGIYEVTLTINNDPCPPAVKTILVNVKGDPAGIEIAQTQFCKTNDTGATEIVVSPAGGVLSIDDVEQPANDKYYFYPAQVDVPPTSAKKDVKLSYTVNGTTAVTTVSVGAPSAEFTATVSDNQKDVTVTPHSYAYPGYIDMGDGNVISTEDGSQVSYMHTYVTPGDRTIVLIVEPEGPCGPVTSFQTVTLQGPSISVSDPRRDFCVNENKDILLQVSPAGGVLTVDGVGQTGQTYVFNPSKAGMDPQSQDAQTVTVNYTFNNTDATETFTINPLPQPSFTAEDRGNRTFRFTNTTEGGNVTRWDFGDTKSGAGEFVMHTYDREGSYPVRLTVSNGKCINMTQQVIEVGAPEVPQLFVDTDARDFCADDAHIVKVQVAPEGGAFSVNGVPVDGTGYDFNPSLSGLKPGDIQSKTYRFDYVLNGTTATEILTVNPLPDTRFFAEGSNMTYHFTNTTENSTVISWDFGDGNTGTGEQTEHVYTVEGTFTVRLTTSNGKCMSHSEQTVQAVTPPKPVLTVSDTRRQFCSDETGVTLTASPAGGVFTQNGSVINGSTFFFNPSQQGVAAGGAAKTVTFNYALNGSNAPVSLTVNPLPLVSFTAVAGTNRNYTFTNTTAGSTVMSWDFGDGRTGTGETIEHTYATEGPYTVRLIVSNGKCPGSAQQGITVARPEQPKISVDVTDRDFCADDERIVHVSVSPAGGVFTLDGNVISGSTYNFSALTSGVKPNDAQAKTFKFSYVLNGTTATENFTVNPLPQVSFGVSGSNMSYRFINTTPGSTVIGWNFGDGQTGTGEQIDHVYATEGTKTVRLTVSNGKCVNYTEQTVQAVAPPMPVLTVSDTRRQFCSDETGVTLTASPAGGVFTKDGSVISGTSFFFNPSQQGVVAGGSPKTITFNYALNGSNAPVSLTVNALPAANFSVSGSNMSYRFTNTTPGSTVISWNFGDGQTGTGEQIDYVFATEGTKTVRLTVSNGKCTSFTEQTVQAVAPPMPVLTVSDTRRQFCSDETGVTLTASPAGGVFTKDGSVISGSTFFFNPSQQGVAAGGSPKTVTFNYALNGSNAPVSLTVNPLPAASFATEIGNNRTCRFTNTTPGSTVVVWNFGDGKTGTGESIEHIYDTENTYTVRLTVSNGKCTAIAQQSVVVVKPQLPQLSISDVRRTFCSDEDSVVVVQASPAGGVFAINGAGIGGTTYNFTPSGMGVNPGSQSQNFTFTYLLNGSTASETMTVQPLPVVSFTAVKVSGMTYRFTNTSGSQVVSWDFADGDGGHGGEDVVDHTFNSMDSFDVNLLVSNGACMNSVTHTITVTDSTGECTLPCNGISETSQYTWPSKESYLRDEIFGQGKMYTFLVTKYSVDKDDFVGEFVPFYITAEQYKAQGFQAIFNAIGSAFRNGLEMTYDPENLQFDNDFVRFNIKRFNCQEFIFEIIDDYMVDDDFRYRYTEKGMFMNEEPFQYEQKLNPVIADDCIDTRTEPCEGKMNMCEYAWPHDAPTMEAWMNEYEYAGYDIVVHNYTVGETVITDHDLHYVIPFSEFRNGLPDAIALLNTHFLFREALYFGYDDRQQSNIITVSSYDCMDFTFDFSVCLTSSGVPVEETRAHYVYTREGSFVYDPDGGSFLAMEPQNCRGASYIAHESAVCNLPCNGLTNTSVYNWPDSETTVKDALAKNGKYSFTVANYIVDKATLNSEYLRFDILDKQFDASGFNAIFSEINRRFSYKGLTLAYYDEVEMPGGKNLGFNFTITRFDCQNFILEIAGNTSDLYSYNNKGLSINDQAVEYPQMLNTVMADACINTRPVPCKGRTTTNDKYTWLNNNDEIKSQAAGGKPYTFTVGRYVVDSQSIVRSSQVHVIPPDAYQNGWSDIAAYLNNHFKLSNGIVFDDRMEGNMISLTFPVCIPFIFEFTIGNTTIQFNEGGSAVMSGK